MSLRLRLIVVVIFVLSISLTLGGVIALLNASRSVQTEMHAALLVGHQAVDDAIRRIDTSPDPQRDLDNLIASFKGNRHLRIEITGGTEAAVQPVNDPTPFGNVPGWFVRLVAVPPELDRVPVTIGGHPFGVVVIETDPRNEILEVWNTLSSSLIVLAVFAGVTIPMIYLFIGRALRPLGRLASALEQIGNGDYAMRIDDRLTPELARLRDSFNRMAARLATTGADNRRLNEQLLTLQEEERNDIARDLHDEVGPFLLAINVDLTAMTRLLRERGVGEASGYLRSIAEAVHHLQRQVRSMLGRLRPFGLARSGLAEALRDLAEFWSRRYPGIDYRPSVAPNCENLGSRLYTTIYRIVQECLSNSLRHGKPGMIAISISRCGRDGEVIVEVADDGAGLRRPFDIGYGLIGMEERVQAMGGQLTFNSPPQGGFVVRAVLPGPEPWPLPPSPLPEAAQ